MGSRIAARALSLLVAFSLPACSAFIRVPGGLPPVPDELLDKPFTPEQLTADLEDGFAILEEVHPDPYTVVSRDEMLRRRAALVASLDRPLTRREFQPRVAELVAGLGDGHTTVYLPSQEWWRYAAGPQGCFPLDLEWDGEKLSVRRTAVVTGDGALAPGARVLSISGRPADEFFRTFLARQSGENEAFRAASVEQALPVHLWLAGIEPPFALRVASALDPSVTFDVEAPGLAWSSVARGDAPSGGPRWQLDRRPDGVAVLAIDTLSAELDAFGDFLADTFQALAAAPPRALVIDLRRNGGGDSRLGDELLQYVASRPWRQASRKEWKMSDRYRAWFKTFLRPWLRWLPVQYLHPTGWRMWTTPAGELYVVEEELREPRDEPLRWHGPLAFLIGPQTFSSAASLAAAVKDCGLGLLVGEATGGAVNAFGEVYPFELPRTRLAGQVSSARFVRPSGDATSRGGVEADVVVRPEPGASGDPVLEAAVARLLGPSP